MDPTSWEERKSVQNAEMYLVVHAGTCAPEFARELSCRATIGGALSYSRKNYEVQQI